MSKILVLAVAVSSKDGNFEDSVKAFAAPTRKLAEKLALAWFVPGIQSWMLQNYGYNSELEQLAYKFSLATSIEDVQHVMGEFDEALDEDTDYIGLNIYADAMELP